MNNNNKNGFLITWTSCIVILLTICFFGISDSIKGTRAAKCIQWGCENGTMYGNSCRITNSVPVTSTTTVSCSNTNCCSGGESASCTYDSSNMQYFCQCTKTSYKYEYKYVSPVCVAYEKEENDENNDINACHNWTEADTLGKENCGAGNYSLTLENGTCYKYSCNYCSYDPWSGSYKDSKGNTCSLLTACPDGWTNTRPNTATACNVKLINGGTTCFQCTDHVDPEEFCGEGTEPVTDESGKTVCVSKCECDEGEDCSEEKQCWNCSGTYFWGLETEYQGCSFAYRNETNCKGTSPNPIPSDPEPSNPSSSNPSSNPSSSSSSSSSTPSTSGCYKNKDTGVAKWFESDPDNNSGTDLYEKVANSECEHNITDNPATGQIAMFIVWIIGFASIGYSIYYLMKFSKSE